MSRYIDADALIAKYGKKLMCNEITSEEYYAIKIPIDYMPTADAVDVVRCKDCVHYQPSLFGEKKMCFRKDVDGVQICYDFSPDDYCSYGERREE